MKNIPLFTTNYGLATLILREIPWSGSAYVLVRSAWDGQEQALLEECKGFCRAVGANNVFAAWDGQTLPAEHAYDLLRMVRPKAGLPESALELEPLTRENADAYLEIYNSCFLQVPGAASYDRDTLEPLYGEELAWLARRDGVWAGVAEISKQGLEGIAVLPQFRGLGYELALAVLPMVPSAQLRLKVADTNTRALALYDRLGFRTDGVANRWYRL